jgi:hypothetical protein
VSRAAWFFLGLGVAIRLVRYLVNYPIWHDEAFLAVNFWDRGYVDLLRPLHYGQIAPWLFLAIERTAVVWLGYSEPVLRFFPTLCSLASVPMFAVVSRQVLPTRARVLAMGIFATSIYTVRHGAEIKPYASDLLVALAVIGLALRWVKRPEQGRWWWVLAAIVPVLVPLSYPSVFVAGGVGAALGPRALRSGRWPVRLGCAVFGVILVASFLSFYAASASFQAEAMRQEYRTGCWAESFPPWERPWAIPLWLLDIHAGTMMAYPVGDRHGGSAATLLCVMVGCLVLMRRGQDQPLPVLLAPLGVGLLAACLGRYPYGGAPRVMQYAAPSICMLAGLGLSVVLERVARSRVGRRGWAGAILGLTLLGTGLMVRDLACPYRVESDVRTREFARRLWSQGSHLGELACLKSDFGLAFSQSQWSVGMSAVYLHHQRMFSPRHRSRGSVNLDPNRYSEDRPLRLVAFDHLPEEVPAFKRWLMALEDRFRLQGRDSFEVQPGKPGEDWLRDAYEILELVPRQPRVATRNSGGEGSRRR